VRSSLGAEQWHEDGQAISCGFDAALVVTMEVAFTISVVVLARQLCPALGCNNK
jgi:hypothetical protein